MNVTKESVDKLNVLLKVTLESADYQPKVDKTLLDYRKKAAIPGFRKGKVPMSYVKKQYGKAVLAEELNKMVSNAIYNYIEDEKLDILGGPLPKEDAELNGDFDNPDTFVFTYEAGLSPEIDIKLSNKSKYEHTKVKIDKKLIDKQIDDLSRRYGKLVSGEVVGEKDMVLGQFVELNEDNTIKEGGILNSSTISLEFVEDKATKKLLVGKRIGEKVNISASKVARGESDMAAMLGIKQEELSGINDHFQFTVNEVKVMEPAELNQELFDKLYGKDEVKSEEEMRNRISTDLAQMFDEDSDKILARRITNDLIDKTKVSLPDDFLKRWILASQKDGNLTMAEIEKEYDAYAKGLKWQLIQKEIFKANDLKLNQEEVLAFTKQMIAKQYAQYGMPAPADKELTTTAKNFLGKKEEAERIYDMVAQEKLTQFFKDTVKLNEKEVDYDTYLKIARDITA